MAHHQRQRWRGDYTLETTGLIHETYLKLAGGKGTEVENRAHFFALASRAMRQILCNHARDQQALKRGGPVEPLQLDSDVGIQDHASPTGEDADALLALDDALKKLEQVNSRQGRVVECRFFGGLTVEETAETLGISTRTVKRDWAVAQAWLQREMKGSA